MTRARLRPKAQALDLHLPFRHPECDPELRISDIKKRRPPTKTKTTARS
jgi:hypothetical protein